MNLEVDAAELQRFVSLTWDSSIVPELCRYVGIPNLSLIHI